MANEHDVVREMLGLHKGTTRKIKNEAIPGFEPGLDPRTGIHWQDNGLPLSRTPGTAFGQLLYFAYLGSAAGTTVSASGGAHLGYDGDAYDPGGLQTGSGVTWRIPLPATGIYRVEMAIFVDPDGTDFTAGDQLRVQRYIDTVSQHVIVPDYVVPSALVSEGVLLHGVQTFRGTAGDLFNIRLRTTMADDHTIDIGQFADDSFIALYQLT